jgi:hypothetical protein
MFEYSDCRNSSRGSITMTVDIANSGFSLCQAKPRQKPYKDESGIWKQGEAARQHVGFGPLRKLYAPEGQPLETDDLPFVTYKNK